MSILQVTHNYSIIRKFFQTFQNTLTTDYTGIVKSWKHIITHKYLCELQPYKFKYPSNIQH